MKYVNHFLSEFRKTPSFTLNDVARFLRYEGSRGTYAKVFMGLMVKSGKAYKITKGAYTLYDDTETVGFPFAPFYYGLGFALTKHRLWTQQANPQVVTTKNVRRGIRKAFGLNFTVSKISKRMFFGYSYAKGQNFYYPVSDIEKTLIDLVYFNYRVEDYVYEEAAARARKDVLMAYLKRCSPYIKRKVLRRLGKFGVQIG